tara:strand:- start:75 stop:758 length:684 start_codon:yes stop_codon:yes gene_type:complete
MANVTVVGYLRVQGTGDQIPLRTDSVAEGTETTITTDSNLTVTAQDIGTYKPGVTIVSGELTAPNGVAYAYILRNGLVLSVMIPNVAGVSNREAVLTTPVTLRPGDQLRVLVSAAATRTASLLTLSSSGQSNIFSGTPSGAGTTNLLNITDSEAIGNTLQGQTVVRACLLTVDGGKILSSGGAWIRNASGQLQGAIPASNPTKVEPMWSTVSIPIGLNFTATVVHTA